MRKNVKWKYLINPREATKVEKKNHETLGLIEYKWQNDKYKPNYINGYIKYK